jgi:hypothetical protein
MKENIGVENVFKFINKEFLQGLKDLTDKVPVVVKLPEKLTDKEIRDICLSYDHSFGLPKPEGYITSGYSDEERKMLIFKVEEMYRLISRTLIENHKILKL